MFDAASNEAVTIFMTRLQGSSGNSPRFDLYDTNGVRLTNSTGGSLSVYLKGFTLPTDGRFVIACRDNAQTFYNLTMIKTAGTNTADEDMMSITPGQTVSNKTVALRADIDVFSFRVETNDSVTVFMSRLPSAPGQSPGPPSFDLYSHTGRLLTNSVGNENSTFLKGFKLPSAGNYLIACHAQDRSDTFGYNFTFINTTRSNAGDEDYTPIESGQTVTNKSIGPQADLDVFTFDCGSSDAVTILMARLPNTTGTPCFDLYSPDGVLLISENGEKTAVLDNYRPPTSGKYLITCRAGDHLATFSYNLTLARCTGSFLVDTNEELAAAQITQGDVDLFEVPAIAGGPVHIRLRRTAGLGNPLLRVYGPDCAIVGSATGTNAAIYIPCAPELASYRVLCRDGGNAADSFSYDLEVTPLVRPSVGETQYLGIFFCTNHVIVRWETNSSGFVLESNPTIDGTNLADWMASPNWTPVLSPRVLRANYYDVNEGAVTPFSRFYRLRCTNCPK